MSNYYESLKGEDKQRYQDKLRVVGLDLTDDPFDSKNSDKYGSDMANWPKTEYGHIFCYFIERPGVFTKQQLMSWKQMTAYNYFQNGFVRTVLSMKYKFGGDNFIVLKALVNPSQNSPDKAHSSWIITREDGQIITAHCTCKAG